jgi:putative inorganic carbon (HCO3(-)) transporter
MIFMFLDFFKKSGGFWILIASLSFGLLSVYLGYYIFVLFIATLLLVLIVEKFKFALILLIFYLPFQIALNIAPGFDVASGRALILMFFAVWLAKSLKSRKLIINFSLQTILLTLFLFLASFSILQSFESERAIRKLLVFYSVFPLYFIITSFVGDIRIIRKILLALLSGGFLLSLFALLQFSSQFAFGIDPVMNFFSIYIAPIFYGNTFGAEVISNPSWMVNVGGITLMRAFALFPDPHMFSFYLGLIIPILFSLIYAHNCGEDRLSRHKSLLVAVFFLMLLSELLTFSRGGYLGLAFSSLVMLALLWKRFSICQKRFWISLSSLSILSVSLVDSSVFSRFLSIFNLKEGSNTERLKNWGEGYRVFSDNILSGVGIGNYSYYLDPLLSYRDPVYAHNLYLDLGAEMGIFALTVWGLLIVSTIWQLYKVSRNSDNDFLSFLSVGLIGSLVWFSVHAFFDTPIYSPQILSIFLIIISISVLVVRCDRMKLE